MLYTQLLLFQNEAKSLAPYAIKSSASKGREYPEIKDPYRTPFQRDRDRIIHSKAFRRLSGKTQVFVASYGDHYRSRLTHTLEVAQVARDIARALGLNEDLTETIALAHDLGHTPFGHAGEDAMNEIMRKFGEKFEHNEQSLRVVEFLEVRSSQYPGLNLSLESLEGLMKHRQLHENHHTPVIHSLEAQVADIADIIAYHHHDLDDGLRAGILQYKEMENNLSFWEKVTEELDFVTLGEERYRKIAINRLISILINDVIEQTNANFTKYQLIQPLSTPMDNALISFSARIQALSDELAEFLGKKFYLHHNVYSLSRQGQKIIRKLFEVYSNQEKFLPIIVREQLKTTPRCIVIKDYIAGMTDNYAISKFEEYKELI